MVSVKAATSPTMAGQDVEFLRKALEEAKTTGVGERHHMLEGAEAPLDSEEVSETPREASSPSRSRWQRFKETVGFVAVPGSGADLMNQSTAWMKSVIDDRAAVTKLLQAAVDIAMSKLDCIRLQRSTFKRAAHVGISADPARGVSEELLDRAKEKVKQTRLARDAAETAINEVIGLMKEGYVFSDLSGEQKERVAGALSQATESGMRHASHVLTDGRKGVDLYKRVESWRDLKELDESQKLGMKKPIELGFGANDFWGKQAVVEPLATKTGLSTIDGVLQPGLELVSEMQSMHNSVHFLSQNLKSFTATLMGACELRVDGSKTKSLGIPAISIADTRGDGTPIVATMDCSKGLTVLAAARFKELDTDKQDIPLSELAESVASWLKFLRLALDRRAAQNYPGPELEIELVDSTCPTIQLRIKDNGFKECSDPVSTPVKYNYIEPKAGELPDWCACLGCVDCCCTTAEEVSLDDLIKRHKLRSPREFRRAGESVKKAKAENDKKVKELNDEIAKKMAALEGEEVKLSSEEAMRRAQAGASVAEGAWQSGGMNLLKGAADNAIRRFADAPDNERMLRNKDQIDHYKFEIGNLKQDVKKREEQNAREAKLLRDLTYEKNQGYTANPVYWNLQYIEPDPSKESYQQHAQNPAEGWTTGLDCSSFQDDPGRACIDMTKGLVKRFFALGVFTAVSTCRCWGLVCQGLGEIEKEDGRKPCLPCLPCGLCGLCCVGMANFTLEDVVCTCAEDTSCGFKVPGCNCADIMMEVALYERENRMRVHMELMQQKNDACAKNFVQLIRTSVAQINKLIPKYVSPSLEPFPANRPHDAMPVRSPDAWSPHAQVAEDARRADRLHDSDGLLRDAAQAGPEKRARERQGKKCAAPGNARARQGVRRQGLEAGDQNRAAVPAPLVGILTRKAL